MAALSRLDLAPNPRAGLGPGFMRQVLVAGQPRPLDALGALAVLAIGAAVNAWAWFAYDRMPPGDAAGYVAQVQYVRDALLEHGRVPLWCVECYAGASQFTGHLKEYLVLPLALLVNPLLATKLGVLLLRVLGGFGLYWLAARLFGAPLAGLVAGYAYAFGSIANHHTALLDLALASALLPASLLAADLVVRRRPLGAVLALGALAAALLVNNWVYALSLPVAVAALMAARVLRSDPAEAGAGAPWQRAGVLRVVAALGVALVLAGSQLAWIAADTRHHALLVDEVMEVGRQNFIERSPFLLVNRENLLAGWLADHRPPGLDITVWDQGGSYLGVVVLGTLLVGWRAPPSAAADLASWARLGLSMSPPLVPTGSRWARARCSRRSAPRSTSRTLRRREPAPCSSPPARRAWRSPRQRRPRSGSARPRRSRGYPRATRSGHRCSRSFRAFPSGACARASCLLSRHSARPGTSSRCFPSGCVSPLRRRWRR